MDSGPVVKQILKTSTMDSMEDRISTDVLVAGGGIMGSSTAYFLVANPNFNGSVTVVEKDPAYQACSTTRSVGSIRQQFSSADNVKASRFGWEFISNVSTTLKVNTTVPDVSLIPACYLILGEQQDWGELQHNHEIQTEVDARVELLNATMLNHYYPWLNTDGIAGGSRGLECEGWFDPYSLLNALRKKAIDLGAVYLNDEVVSVKRDTSCIKSVTLRSGNSIDCGALVNAAGPYAGDFATLAGIWLPVGPRKRNVFVLHCRETIKEMPMVIDISGFYVRPEGEYYLCGISPTSLPDPKTYSLEVDYSIFDQLVWPLLANRIPAFESVRVVNAWAGHYDYNEFDMNGIVGAHPEISNYYFANGFSGHGLQQAPAVGRGLSELLTFGEYRSLDLSRLSYARILNEQSYAEKIII